MMRHGVRTRRLKLDGFDTPIAREGDDETIDDYTRVCIFMYTNKDMKVCPCTTRRKMLQGKDSSTNKEGII
jgi:hypothetical protein